MKPLTATMKPLPHRYEVRLTGGPDGYAELSTYGAPNLQVAPPAEYDGPGDAWSPEHLLIASVQACFLLTLRAIAHHSNVEFAGVELDAAGTVDRVEGVTRFTEIVLRPTITLRAGFDNERVLRIVEKSEQACLVSASLATPIRLEPRIRRL